MTGWAVAAVMFVVLLIERGCVEHRGRGTGIRDQKTGTIRVKGDAKLVKVQDTVIKWKYRNVPQKADADSDAIIADYYRKFRDVYTDTVKGNDVVVAIKDSSLGDTAIHRQVSIQNKREKLVVQVAQPKNKVFIGGFIGMGLPGAPGSPSGAVGSAGPFPSAGLSLNIVTRQDQMYWISYDALNATPSIGCAWKIHFGK